MKKFLVLLIGFFALAPIKGENGYDLWLRYHPISEAHAKNYKATIQQIITQEKNPSLEVALKELQTASAGLLNSKIPIDTTISKNSVLVIGTSATKLVKNFINPASLSKLGEEGYQITQINENGKKMIIISANTGIGVLYGTFHFIRLLQTMQPIENLNIVEIPKVELRLLNHWDNLNRTVERGYAGFSLWDWHKLPDYLSTRYTDYARANASIGINGAVLTNVNANALVLTTEYLGKVAALANVFRPYGIKVYLTARFSAPMEIGGLKTADPLDKDVIEWWNKKANEIYSLIPDFGGFLVKANSEGQPGPQDYGRDHAQGANLLANALAPHKGIVMWRAFVYSHEAPEDRAKQAYNEFKPLDGKFLPNVLVQIKNGPIDFQPREPFHPLFGALPKTNSMMEFQITQEYLGFSTHLVYLAPLFKETLESDTWCNGQNSTVAKVLDGSLQNQHHTGMAGVANIGNDINWCGGHFAQANWYSFGRLSWDHSITSEKIADEWLGMTFSNDNKFLKDINQMMIASREMVVDYMTPLGLHHIMGWDHHHGPGPWIDKGRPDWTSVYYHKADAEGIGFDRSPKGSNAVEQYFPPVAELFGNREKCPEKLLLWFHHVKWDDKLKSGKTLWEEICLHYQKGLDGVRNIQKTWEQQKAFVDEERFEDVKAFLAIQEKEARWWHHSCILYFQSFSKRPIPEGVEKPDHSLDYYKSLQKKFVPGI